MKPKSANGLQKAIKEELQGKTLCSFTIYGLLDVVNIKLFEKGVLSAADMKRLGYQMKINR